jgi:ATP synthase protein I
MAEPHDDAALRGKSAALKAALAKRRAEGPGRSAGATTGADAPDSSAASGMSLGMKAASEFIAAVVVGAAIGWGLDRLLATKPLFIIVFFLIGVAAGVWNVIRATSPKGAP